MNAPQPYDAQGAPLRAIWPNVVTAGAIFCGYLSIVFALEGSFYQSALFILLAALLDMADGQVARALRVCSDFGMHFDSLADVVNYGVAPSLLFYLLYFQPWGAAGLGIGFLLVLCAAMRLARYNSTTAEDPPYFTGLPSTMAATFLAGYVLFSDAYINHNAPLQAAFVFIVVALLMVSEVRYGKGKTWLSPRLLRQRRHIVVGTVVLPFLLFYPTFTFFSLALFYILWGVSRSGIHTIKDHVR